MKLNFETDGLNFNNKGKPDEIATPIHICRDMSNLFDYTNCNRKIWMDMYCKTGNTLEALKENGVNKNNIAAVCNNKQSQMLVCRKLYGELLPEIEVEITVKSLEAYKITRRGQVYWVSNWQDIVKNHYQDAYNIIKFVILKEMEKTMQLEWNSDKEFQINNIIMNPPYNNDMYIDFVELAHKIASENVVAITPAKWQAKGGQKNEDFRKNIVPYMSRIVYYPDSCDIFDIAEHGGISYYLIANSIHNIKFIKNEMVIYTNDEVRKLNNNLWNIGDNIVTKINISKQLDIFNIQEEKNCYKCTIGKKIIRSGSGHKDTKGKFTCDYSTLHNCIVLSDVGIEDSNYENRLGDSVAIYYGSKEQCSYFRSYINSKFVRFLVLMSIHGVGIYDRETWRFVPAPKAFDHIFTDQELYEEYNLTSEEINIIESVIKERK